MTTDGRGTTEGAVGCESAGEERPDARRPGRPRDERADRAIVAATLELLADDGYHALSVEAVAARAGVGKTTIYRRWPGKRELVVEALLEVNAGMPNLPPPGPTVPRVLAMMAHVCQKDPGTLQSRILPRMLAYRASHPDLYQEYVERVIRPRRERLQSVLRDGIERGDVRPDVDVELAALSLTSPLIMLEMTRMPEERLTVATAEALLRIVWPGIGTDPDAAASLLGDQGVVQRVVGPR
jgi:AcrR family transcriptional regulator